jgi:hypothetical protein
MTQAVLQGPLYGLEAMTKQSHLRFDLRFLALDKLMNISNGSRFVYYKEARRYLGILLHLNRLETRSLLLEMSKQGLVSFDMRGKIWIGNRHSRHGQCRKPHFDCKKKQDETFEFTIRTFSSLKSFISLSF